MEIPFSFNANTMGYKYPKFGEFIQASVFLDFPQTTTTTTDKTELGHTGSLMLQGHSSLGPSVG